MTTLPAFPRPRGSLTLPYDKHVMDMSDRDRVARALRYGPVNPADFHPPTIDGGGIILRLAPRIHDLIKKHGWEIAGERQENGTKTYSLVREGGVERCDTGKTAESPRVGIPTGAVSLGAPLAPVPGDTKLAPLPQSPGTATLFDWPAVAA